jgi:hypothetical protein
LVPIPFLDDHMVRVSRRRMVREMALDQGVALDDAALRVLSGTARRGNWGCLLGAALAMTFKVVAKLLRRVVRSLLFWLAIKDASDAASRTFHEGFLLHAGLTETPGAPLAATELNVAQLRLDLEAVCREVDTRPVQKAVKGALRGSWRLLRAGARRLARRERRAKGAEHGEVLEQEIPGELVDRISSTLSAQRGYLLDLEARFRSRRQNDGPPSE